MNYYSQRWSRWGIQFHGTPHSLIPALALTIRIPAAAETASLPMSLHMCGSATLCICFTELGRSKIQKRTKEQPQLQCHTALTRTLAQNLRCVAYACTTALPSTTVGSALPAIRTGR